jgi:hypothetical protein
MLLMNPQCGSRNLPLVCIYYTFNTRSLGISVHAVDMENPTDGSRLSKLCWTSFSGLYFYLEVIFLPLRLKINTSSRVLVVTDAYSPRWLEISQDSSYTRTAPLSLRMSHQRLVLAMAPYTLDFLPCAAGLRRYAFDAYRRCTAQYRLTLALCTRTTSFLSLPSILVSPSSLRPNALARAG